MVVAGTKKHALRFRKPTRALSLLWTAAALLPLRQPLTVIVVGVDGSEASNEALRSALEESRLRRSALRAVYAWFYPQIGGRGYIPPELLNPELPREVPRSGSMHSSLRWRARTVESSSSGSSGKGRRPKCYPRWAGPRSHIRYGAKTVANQGATWPR